MQVKLIDLLWNGTKCAITYTTVGVAAQRHSWQDFNEFIKNNFFSWSMKAQSIQWTDLLWHSASQIYFGHLQFESERFIRWFQLEQEKDGVILFFLIITYFPEEI